MDINDLRVKNYNEFREHIIGQMGGYYNHFELCDSNWISIIRNVYNYFAMYDSGVCSREKFLKVLLKHQRREYDLSDFLITDVIEVIGSDTIFNSRFYSNLAANGTNNGAWMDLTQANLTSDMMNNLTNFIMNYSNVRTVEKFFRKKFVFDFNESSKILTLVNPPQYGNFVPVMLRCYVIDDLNDLFNNLLFQKLVKANAKIQWAKNMEGKLKVEFPNGEINVEAILTEGKEEKEKLEKEIKDYNNHSIFKIT